MYYQYVSSYSFKLLHVLSVTVLNTFVRIGLKMTWSLYRFCDPRAEGKKSLIIFQSLFGMVSPILCKWLIIYYCLCHTTIKGRCHKQREWAITASSQQAAPQDVFPKCFSCLILHLMKHWGLRVGLFDNSTYKTNDSIILYFMNDEKLLYFPPTPCWMVVLSIWMDVFVLSRKGEHLLCCNFGRSCIFLSKCSSIKVP